MNAGQVVRINSLRGRNSGKWRAIKVKPKAGVSRRGEAGVTLEEDCGGGGENVDTQTAPQKVYSTGNMEGLGAATILLHPFTYREVTDLDASSFEKVMNTVHALREGKTRRHPDLSM